MSNELMQRTPNTLVAANDINQFRTSCQAFIEKLNNAPGQESIDQTPDGKASTILISHIEMLLDEYFFGLWETENFKWAVIANEIVGSIDLCFYHPVTGIRMKRTGAASVQIMVDKGTNPLEVTNKKPNALDMGFPKLKAECLKNAANSLGKMFGRDLNRKKQDVFRPLLKVDTTKQLQDLAKLQHGTNI